MTLPADQAQLRLTKWLQNDIIFVSYKTSEFLEKSPLSGSKKHRDYTLTLTLRYDTIDTDFACIYRKQT